jgi:4-amino-4-deoxy-L-arabinose transferase-like glycosyltransferase
MDGHDRTPPRFHLIILILAAGLLFFGRLGCPLQEPEEPRYAEIPRQMLAHGSFAVPVLHGLPYYDKPPLLYWLIMASYSLFGVHDWAARLVSCAAGFATVLVTYFWGRQTVGPRAAFAAAMILSLSARFVYLGRLLTMNSLLCLWVVAALALAHTAIRDGRLRWSWWLLSAACCALGLLSKGPVTLALVLVPVLAMQILDRQSWRPAFRAWLAYVALALGLACPWYAAVAAIDPDFLGYFFWKHNVVRYVAPFDHAKPFWYYLPELFLGMLPWSLLIPVLKLLARRSAASIKWPRALRFFLIASLWCLLFYSTAGSKRAAYILPAMPPLALALGTSLDVALACSAEVKRYRVQARAEGRWWAWCGVATFATLLAALHLVLPGYARQFSMRGQVRPFADQLEDEQIPVVCYPRGWDSVNFYLRREQVEIFAAAEREQLIARLSAQPRTLVFIKSDHSVDDLLHDLPPALEFVPQGRQGNAIAGWIQRSEIRGQRGQRSEILTPGF